MCSIASHRFSKRTINRLSQAQQLVIVISTHLTGIIQRYVLWIFLGTALTVAKTTIELIFRPIGWFYLFYSSFCHYTLHCTCIYMGLKCSLNALIPMNPLSTKCFFKPFANWRNLRSIPPYKPLICYNSLLTLFDSEALRHFHLNKNSTFRVWIELEGTMSSPLNWSPHHPQPPSSRLGEGFSTAFPLEAFVQRSIKRTVAQQFKVLICLRINTL